jgi:hypothetical protein
VHNLRGALDHLAFLVAKHNGASKKVLRVVDFPTRKSSEDFAAAMVTKQIARMGRAWVDLLSAVEPFYGGKGEILCVISALDNIDKHRNLLAHQLLGDKYSFDGTKMVPIKRAVSLEGGPGLSLDANADNPTYTQVRITINECIPGLELNAWAQDTLNNFAFSVGAVLGLAQTATDKLFPLTPRSAAGD